MQHNDTTGKFALLTHQELAYLSDGLPQLTNAQKSKLNYKIKKKIEIFERVELPLLMRSGFELGSASLSVENDNKNCHSFAPGSKFGLKKKKPNGHSGRGLLFAIMSRIETLLLLIISQTDERTSLSESKEKVVVLTL
jgi:hypothetical protein